MSRKNEFTARDAQQLANFVRQLPPKVLLLLVVIGVIAVTAYFLLNRPAHGPAPGQTRVPEGTILFCSWNVENFYDDEDDPKNSDEMENFFATHKDMFELKVAHLTEALLLMNDGRGPDVMALCEVESERCLNALKDSLDAALEKAGKGDMKYGQVLFKGDKLGRRFAPGIVTRIHAEANRTRKITDYAGNGRTIEGHLWANDHELIVMAAHWTSRVDSGGGKSVAGEPPNSERRMSYARDCYGRFREIVTANPEADIILCGDFNDEFKDRSIQDGLHATANPEVTLSAPPNDPRPLALLANWNGEPPGSIYGKGHWSVFDHLLVSKGMLDGTGWTCERETAAIFGPARLRHAFGKSKVSVPFRFGSPNESERGYADHLPVIVRLKVPTPAP